jgi:hypothetical protein
MFVRSSKGGNNLDSKRRICFFGKSVILGTLEASLRNLSQYEITTIDPEQIHELPDADVMFFDLEAPRPQEAFYVLENRPGLLLIGVSPDKNTVKVWSGQQLQELSIQGLLDVMDQQLNNSSIHFSEHKLL